MQNGTFGAVLRARIIMMITRRFAAAFALTALLAVGLPTATFAAVGLVPIVPEACNGPGGCQSICAIGELAQNIMTDAVYIAVFLSGVLFAWAGVKFLTGGSSSSEARSQAKKILWYVVGGLVLILISWLVVNLLITSLTNLAGWNHLC